MISVLSLSDAVARECRISSSRVKQIARRLIEDGELPKSSGRAIIQAGPLELARLLTAVCVSETNVDASVRARDFLELEAVGQKAEKGLSFMGLPTAPATFEDALIGLIITPFDRARRVRRIDFDLTNTRIQVHVVCNEAEAGHFYFTRPGDAPQSSGQSFLVNVRQLHGFVPISLGMTIGTQGD